MGAEAHLVGRRLSAAAAGEGEAILAPMPTPHQDALVSLPSPSSASSCHQSLQEGLPLPLRPEI
jgi:hypothetical protein